MTTHRAILPKPKRTRKPIKAKDIAKAWATSKSPLVLQVIHSDGSSDSYTVSQMDRLMTDIAQDRARFLARVDLA